jgi:hypothetical protein
MTIQHFYQTYDYPGCIVLLEGKRAVAMEDADKLRQLGRLLALNTQHIKFRSGNAPGADQYFSEGVMAVDISRLQLVKPYKTHRSNALPNSYAYSLDDLNLAADDDLVKKSMVNERTERMVKHYVTGARDGSAMKAAYLIRDTMKVIGAEGLPPAHFAVFYDDLNNPCTGGTGHTMQVCRQNKVPFVDQRVWFGWLR